MTTNPVAGILGTSQETQQYSGDQPHQEIGPGDRFVVFGFLMADDYRQADTALLRMTRRALATEPEPARRRIV